MEMAAGTVSFVAKECLVVKFARKWWRIGFVCLFCLQLAVLYVLHESLKGDDRSIPPVAVPVSAQELALRTFLKLGAVHRVPIFPMDKRVFDLVSHKASSLSFCSYFCWQGVVSTFATFNELFQEKDGFLQSLKEARFKYVSTVHTDTDHKLSSPLNLTTHYVVSSEDGFVIHLAIFHHHEGNFWWHGALQPQPNWSKRLFSKPGPSLPNFTFSSHEGAYDKFVTQELNLGGSQLYFPADVPQFLRQMDQSRFVACNRSRARLFEELYGVDRSPEALSFKRAAVRLLSITKMALDKIGVPFWLSSGTCLGYFRQCDVFPHGKDVDIGIFIRDYDRLIVRRLTLAGMKLKHRLGKIEDSLELSFVLDGLKLDIFFFYEAEDHMWNGGLQTKSGKKFKYVFPKFTLCWTEFLGLKVRVPCQAREYLEANYGPHWFQPVLQWDWKSSPYNVRENGHWPEREWSRVIQQFDV